MNGFAFHRLKVTYIVTKGLYITKYKIIVAKYITNGHDAVNAKQPIETRS